MAKRTVSVKTEHGTFLRTTDNEYVAITVGLWRNGTTIGTTWHYSLANAMRGPHYFAKVLGFYSVATGEKLAPGFTVQPGGRRAARVEKPVIVHEFEKCSECDRRHDPARLRCGNCWRCHEPTVKCKVTKAEVQASIERHNKQPEFFRVLTTEWRPFDQVHVPQCACHGKGSN